MKLLTASLLLAATLSATDQLSQGSRRELASRAWKCGVLKATINEYEHLMPNRRGEIFPSKSELEKRYRNYECDALLEAMAQ